MAEQPIKAPVPVWQSPSPSAQDRGRAGAAADPVAAVPGLDVSAMNRELLDTCMVPPDGCKRARPMPKAR